jgi:leucyl aminopeptidase
MNRLAVLITLLIAFSVVVRAEEQKVPDDRVLIGPEKARFIVRAQGPYDAAVPLQIVCYFKHKKEGNKTLGAAVELDKRLNGAIASLRNRGEFIGDTSEVLLLTSPKGTIKPQALLLIGLGDEAELSLATMERIGRVALREAVKLGITRVAFAPLIRDQGNDKLAVGDVSTAFVRGMLLAYDTEKRLQREGLTKAYTVEEWIVEAGPTFFNETVTGVEKGIGEAKDSAARRSSEPYAKQRD